MLRTPSKTLADPFDVDALLAYHRANFGDARMEDPPEPTEDELSDEDKAELETKGKDLGEPGKKALTEERVARRAAEKTAEERRKSLNEVKPLQKLAAELKLTPDQIREAVAKAGKKADPPKGDPPEPTKDHQPDVDEIRSAARREAQEEMIRERALDKVEAKAAADFKDPDLVRGALAAKVDEFITADNTVDVDAIEAALKELLTKRPHLARDAKTGPKKDPSQGARPGDGTPSVTAGKELFDARHPRKSTATST